MNFAADLWRTIPLMVSDIRGVLQEYYPDEKTEEGETSASIYAPITKLDTYSEQLFDEDDIVFMKQCILGARSKNRPCKVKVRSSFVTNRKYVYEIFPSGRMKLIYMLDEEDTIAGAAIRSYVST